ncbi:hypothetical protein P4U05_17105 [Bacillus paranthracis]|uniref:hypothetical protein n=1 Tax=Bacillus paranthracis TaxID=2026186 RepID=UPI000200F2A0|nr:hypothetical protein [Bacillus paranthracis]ADY20325.1 hypothetical protein YBT020_05395 [Bacillus thuringiensis serovar finitimus YBT-020]MRC72821.1 hypothetical protein [Bacillus thuringiensis]OTX71275.1 hypothetical protein BK722_12745 [Bacillus thuringiensis serovar finitimus]PGZ45728.1 hypothetical protein COE56_25950 [Bacillus anthracis]MCR6799396.1 hypothetical protein [Bacillus paranthracis]
MTAYLISYDLNKSGKKYNELYESLKSYEHYWHYLDSTWIIKTDETTQQIFEKIKVNLDDDDTLLIIEIKNNKQGWLPQSAWDYLNNTIFN